MPVEKMRGDINMYGVADFEATAVTGVGVFETLRSIVTLTTERVKVQLQQ
jgi:hypothetical protein